MKLSTFPLVEVIRKEITTNIRQRAILASMLMFSLTTLACISLVIKGTALEPELLSALLWIIIFFASSAINQTFEDEAISTLKVYGDSQSILFGKMIYAFTSMIALMLFLLPAFLILFDYDVAEPFILIVNVSLGMFGISSAGTLISAISSVASIKSGLFPILLFPIILPVFLLAIDLTTNAFIGREITMQPLLIITIYDLILTLAGSILFDSLWY